MAEENEEKKDFYPFTIKRNNNSERQKKIDELKKKFALEDILKVLATDDGDDDATIEAKLKALKARELQENLVRELNAMDAAVRENAEKKKKYKEKRKKGKDEPEEDGGKIKQAEEYFQKQDEYNDKHYAEKYHTYELELADIQQQEISEAKRQALIADLETKYDDVIKAEKELRELREGTETKLGLDELYQNMDRLERLPEEVQKNILDFYHDCKDKGQMDTFNDAFAEFITDDRFFPQRAVNEDGKPGSEMANRHEFDLYKKKNKDGSEEYCVRHSIYNLDSSGLDICMIDNKFSFAHCPSNLTEAQIKALAEYCHYNGIQIDDYYKLNDLKVLDKDNNEIGSAAKELERHLKELDGAESSRSTNAGPTQETDVSGDFGKYLPPLKDLDVKRSSMVAATKKRIGLMGFPPESGLVVATRGWNSTIISVYASENDKLIDGEVDKNGKRQHSKQFAIELIHSTPPRAKIYIEPGKKFEADHARLALDAFKAAGCKYFITPSADQMGGKPVNGAFMKASVKTGMVPYLKGSKDGKGGFIGAPDLETILEELPKEAGLKPIEKVEYQMRLYQQMQKYMNWPGEDKRNKSVSEQLGTLVAKVEYGAKFGMFTNSYLEKLQDHIEKGMNGEVGDRKWDSVDQVTATAAMTKILKDISKGQLNGKPYNPIANPAQNEKALIDALTSYMAQERPLVEKEIEDNISKLNLENTTEAKTKAAVNTALRARKEALDKTCEGLKGYGVEVKPKIVAAKEDYSRDKVNKGKGRDDDDDKKKRHTYSERYGSGVQR